MAGNAEVIREFLVALGFKVDQKGLKTFKEGVEDSTKGVVRLVATIQGAALTIGASVAGFASKIESLYFVGRRVGATENSLRALGGAARDFGVSADVALGSVEAIAKFMRNNPAGESYIASLGVQTRDANGNLRDTVDLIADIGRVMASKPTWLANQYGSVLGIDENLMLAMRDPAFIERLRQIRKESENNGMSRAAKDAHELMTSIRELGRTADNMFTLIQADLQEKVGPELKRFSAWFKDNAPEIAKRISDVAQVVLRTAETILPILGAVIEKFVEWDKATNGWTTNILLAVAALKVLGGFQILSGLGKLAGALRGVGVAAAAAQAGAAAGGAAAAGAGVAAGATIGTTALAAAAIGAPIAIGGAYLQHQMTGTEEGIKQRIADRQARIKEKDELIELDPRNAAKYQAEKIPLERDIADYTKKLEQLKAGQAAAPAPAPGPQTSAPPNAMAAALFDNLEKHYGLPQGLLDSVWLQESGRGKNMLSPAGAEGHFQFMPATAKEMGLKDPSDLEQSADAAARYLKWLLGQTGGDLKKALAAYNGGIGNLGKLGLDGMPAESQKYYRDVLSRLEQQPWQGYYAGADQGQTVGAEKGKAVSMNANTTIYVSGARDPKAVAEAVAGEQARVNDAAVRTIGGAQG
ncbi:lytic transglycosylase domain-containing protein [Achromobacter sp. Marseille-Q0513]|uniref:lytic transglycosylase domain-containing protein n=1 Tax=Achromobacter sp. Marseille-Q0513 TaxID=2829161 RepID=UPI001BA32547|nr:lytic transglycosylase domain-containing protein [Achromobacter sp. Marseille-Q0513]MBR8654288.1 lytic transglycosylase domain-containing protein [Achromobacter sp. Marseille-Q0513]